ncbi:MAG: fructokinase [Halieaceae bacterium]
MTRLPERLLPSRACYCGRSDCIETWLSGAGLALTHEQLHAETIDENDLKGAQAGGALRETLDTYREMLAAALATVVNLLDPGVIVLGGGLSNNQTLYAELPELLADQVFSDYFATRIRPAQHGDSSGVRGAAWLWP